MGLLPFAVAATVPSRVRGGSSTGGSLTVLESPDKAWQSLDPATIARAPINDLMDAIYGDLFQEGPNGKIVPDLATSYRYSNGGKTFTIKLRSGLTFTDGTPLNAQAVAWNFSRDLKPPSTQGINFPVISVSTPDSSTVVLELSKPDSALKYAFFGSTLNWIASPTAFSKLGEKVFSERPVGAGPFQVVSNVQGTKLVLTKNPTYWQKGHPFLSSLTFTITGSDESAIEAIQAGSAGAYPQLELPSLVHSLPTQLRATRLPALRGNLAVNLNTKTAPFSGIKAREALYYATDPEAINSHLFFNMATIVESPSDPHGLFYQQRVPGYRRYNLKKAKALVQQLGGLSVTLVDSIGGTPKDTDLALQSEWEAAGIHVTVKEDQLTALVSDLQTGNWEADLYSTGGFDPALGTGLPFGYESGGLFSGVHDPTLDQLINRGESTFASAAQKAIYRKIWHRISSQAYSPFISTELWWNITAKSVSGPGLTTPGWEIWWQDVKSS